jgi:hypothetical protein
VSQDSKETRTRVKEGEMITKGEWKVWNLEDGDKGWTIQQGEDGRFIARTHDNTGEDLDNARIIVAAVNACTSVNPDGPMAVAESIKDMYEALKIVLPWAKEWIRYLRNTVGQGQGQNADEQFVIADKALAKAEGREDGNRS